MRVSEYAVNGFAGETRCLSANRRLDELSNVASIQQAGRISPCRQCLSRLGHQCRVGDSERAKRARLRNAERVDDKLDEIGRGGDSLGRMHGAECVGPPTCPRRHLKLEVHRRVATDGRLRQADRGYREKDDANEPFHGPLLCNVCMLIELL